MSERPILIAYTADEATSLLSVDADGALCLGLSPIAAATFREAGRRTITPRERFTDYRFARAIAAYRSQLRILEGWCDEDEAANDCFRHLMSNTLRSFATTVYRLDACLGQTGEWIYAVDGDIRRTRDRQQAYREVLQSILEHWSDTLVGYLHGAAPPIPGLYRVLRNAAVSLLPRRRRAVLVRRSAHPYGLTEAVRDRGVDLLYVGHCEGNWRDYLKLGREVFRYAIGRDYVQFGLVEPRNPPPTKLVDDFLARMTDDGMRTAFAFFRDEFAEKIDRVMALRDDAASLISKLSPHLFLSYEIADCHSALVADAARDIGIKRVIANHNTHAPCEAGISGFMAREVFKTLHPPRLTDTTVLWTPDSVETAEQSAEAYRALEVIRVRRPLDIPDRSGTDRQRMILYAGNFHRWFHVSNWMFELSDEYLEGLRSFCEATKDIPDVRVLARIKFRLGELDRQSVEAMVGHYNHLDLIQRSDRRFEEDLVDCDLLVSYSSTTIHQALAFRRPVFFWGGSPRYRRIKAQMTPPSARHRSAVYTCLEPEDVGDMVAGILDVHAGKDLDWDEVRPFVHGADSDQPASTVDDVAADLCRRYLP